MPGSSQTLPSGCPSGARAARSFVTCSTVWARWSRIARAARSGVAGLARLEDLAVLAVEPWRRHALRGVDLQVGVGGGPQLRDQLDEPVPAREPVESHVELVVELDVSLGIGARGHLVEDPLERRGIGRREVRRGSFDGQRLERRPDLVMLLQVVDGRNEHGRAALRVHPHEAFVLEDREGLAHGRGADVEAVGELYLAQPHAGGEAAGGDVGSQGRRDRLGDGAPGG